VAGGLAKALSAPVPDEALARSLTHAFHSYPARMHPATARVLIELALERAGRRGRKPPVVLDPFCGSGTVLVEARRVGARARGIDANPLAVLIARGKTSVGRPEHRAALRSRSDAIAAAVIEAGREAKYSGGGSRRKRTPRGADTQKRQRQLAHWFAPHVRRELEALAAEIEKEPQRRGAVLTAVLSSILYKVSKRESDTSAERVERKVARGAAARLFQRRTAQLVDGLDTLAEVDAPGVGVADGDARQLGRADITAASVDAIVTSPPYVGTYDYIDYQGLRFAFLGLGAGRAGTSEIGARRGFRGEPMTRKRALERWQRDLSRALAQMALVLRAGGQLAIVTGDSMAGGRAVFAEDMLERCMPSELTRVAMASQGRTAYGVMEQRAFAKREKREHIVLFEKS